MGSPIRVLHAVVNMNRGGAETLIMNLYRNIDRSKIQFDFLTSKEGVFDQEIIELGGRIHRIPYITDGGHRQYIKHLNQFFKENSQYKIVHSHMDKMSGFVLRAAKKAGIAVRIAHSHSTQSEGNIATKLYKFYAGIYIEKSASHFLSCSAEAAEWLFQNKVKETNILKNGIDFNKFKFSSLIRNSVRTINNISEDTFVVGHIGRFCTPKNHSFIIDIFSNLLKVEPNSLLILVGDGPLRPSIEEKVKQLNLSEKVKFIGVRNDVEHLLQAFDLFLFPSVYEGLPVTLIEAQGSGLPCLISDTITSEVDMKLNLIHYAPLNNLKVWIDRLIEISKEIRDRNLSNGCLSDNEFDIKDSSKWTKEYYLAITR